MERLTCTLMNAEWKLISSTGFWAWPVWWILYDVKCQVGKITRATYTVMLNEMHMCACATSEDATRWEKETERHPATSHICYQLKDTCQYEEEIGDIKGDFTNDGRVMLTQCLSQKQNKRRGKRPSPRHGNIMCPDSYQHAGLIEAWILAASSPDNESLVCVCSHYEHDVNTQPPWSYST